MPTFTRIKQDITNTRQDVLALISDDKTTPEQLSQALDELSYMTLIIAKEYRTRLNSAISGISFEFGEMGTVKIEMGK